MNVETVHQFPLFVDLPESEIEILAESSQISHFQAGEVLFIEGSSTAYFYLILEGEVEIIKSLGTNDERCVAISQKESILGEMSAFSQNETHTASVRTHTPCIMLKVPFDQFDAVLRRHLLQIDCSDMFVTLLYGILDCKTQGFSYARAGHPQPLLLDRLNKPISIPYELGQAIGIFEAFDIDEEHIAIPEGGTLLIYSDGLSETIQDQEDSPNLPELCSSLLEKKT